MRPQPAVDPQVLPFPVPATAEGIGGKVRSSSRDHLVQFYDDESFLATVVSEFLQSGLAAGSPVIVIARAPHRRAFVSRLRAGGVDVSALRRAKRFVLHDADEVLARLMVDGTPDPHRFRAIIGRALDRLQAAAPGVPIRAYGEMVDVLWRQGNQEAAIRLEELWNDLAASYDFDLLCAYAMTNFASASDSTRFEAVCATHSHVSPTERYVLADSTARMAEVSRLEQRARALEFEIVERERLSVALSRTVVELREREQDLRDVLDNAAVGIHKVSADGTIQWANAAELEMVGYSADEYIGRPIADFHVDADVIATILSRLAAGETLREVPARLRRKDGSIRDVLINSNVRWSDGKFLHTRCFTRDVTELRLAMAEREELLRRERMAREEAERARADAERTRTAAEQANRAKSEFLAVMSHELRTPLNAIGGYAELMELGIHGQITPPQRDALDKIQRSQRLLLGLINQVLNYTRIETGNVRYELGSVSVAEALRTAEALVTPQLHTNGLHFRSGGCAPDLVVIADPDKVQQIVLNLLANAMKFTERGGRVRIDVDEEPQVVRIRVSDTGIGIAPEKLETIFDPFVQVDAHYTRTRDGVGLGLAISRDLARGMKGDLTVQSVTGQGSTFTLTLPRG
jgi:PAS domain S-box-containing protein